jgi:hypothetical protein
MVKLKIDGLVYFLTKDSHELLIESPNSSILMIQRLALAIIDPSKCEVVKSRYTLEDVFTKALEDK